MRSESTMGAVALRVAATVRTAVFILCEIGRRHRI